MMPSKIKIMAERAIYGTLGSKGLRVNWIVILFAKFLKFILKNC